MSTETATPCPVAQLAIEYGKLAKLDESLDAIDQEPDRQQDRAVDDRLDAIMEEVSWLTPTGATGAAFQLMMASASFDAANSSNDEHNHRKGQRCLYGVLEFLAATDHAAIDELTRRRCMLPDFDDRLSITQAPKFTGRNRHEVVAG
jgi:hypothetical protein